MKFRAKPVEVEAYQVSPQDGHARTPAPQWVLDAIASQRLRPQAGGLALNERPGEMLALVDDWLVRTPDGKISVYTPAEFAERYERVDE